MTFQWQIMSESVGPPFGVDAWSVVALPPTPGVIRYGFQVTVGEDTPATWNTVGFFGLLTVNAGRPVLSRTYPIPLLGDRSNPVIRQLGLTDFDVLTEGFESSAVAYSIHRWVRADKVRVWGLFDV